MNIRVDLNYPIKDGTEVVFRSPVDCSQVTGLKVYYHENGATASKEFAFADAHGNNVGDIDHLFAEDVAVKVILDVTTGMAFVQNADTNAYLEGRFEEISADVAELNSQIEGVLYSKNLIPADYADDDHLERYGITYQKRADGTVLAAGTATNTSRYIIMDNVPIQAGTYTLSGIPAGETSSRQFMYRIGESGSWASSFRSGTRTITVEADSTLSLRIQYNSGYVADNQLWKPMLEKGSVAHDFVSPGTTIERMQKTVSQHTEQISAINKSLQNLNSLGLNILCLGDSIFGNDGQIVEYLAQLTGCNVVRGAIGGTRVSIRSSGAFGYLDGQNLVQALTSGDWTEQDAAVASLQDAYTWLPDRIATLKALDMSAVDLVIMNWGTNDYAGGHTIEEICTAYGSVIDALQSTYPELRILITTPIWRYFDDAEDGSKVNGDNKVYADATLKQIAEAIEAFAKDKRISALNAYQNMPLSYNTAATYFDANDGTHLNAKGNMVYAHLLNGKIRSMY